MNFKKSQSGRSMVEMLGVLAIIGVLSVGGIAGYSLSMRRHRANQIADIAAKYALTVYTACQQRASNGETGSLSGDFLGCGSNNLEFEDTGIGALPAGVKTFGHSDLIEGPGHPYPDMVHVYIQFTDQKLCQAVASTLPNVENNSCSYQNGPYISFFIKNN